MKIGRYDVPTPLVLGGVAGVGVLVLGQRLTGRAPTAADSAPAGQAAPDTSSTATDLWGASEVGQFPSLPPSGGTGDPNNPNAGFGWWDPNAPPPSGPPINSPPTPTPTPTPAPAPTPTPAPALAPIRYSIRIAQGATVRWYRLSPAGCILSWVDRVWTNPTTTQSANAPVSRRTCDGRSSATTSYVTSGSFASHYVRIGSGVTLLHT